MLMMVYIERTSSNAGRKMEKEAICWTQNGTVVVVRDTNDLYLKWLRRFFGSLKYESFIRKIYRWGFRKSPSISYALPPTCHVFSNTNFCRDQADRLCEMKSTTAAKGHSAVKMPEVTDQPEQNRALGQSSNRAVEATWNSVPNPGNPFLSLSDPQQHYPRPHVSSHASLLEQHLRSVQVRTHLSYLMLFQLRNDAIYGNDTLDLLALRLRLNQPLEPQAPSILDLVQLLRQQNTIRPMQSPNATLDELIRRLRQNSHR